MIVVAVLSGLPGHFFWGGDLEPPAEALLSVYLFQVVAKCIITLDPPSQCGRNLTDVSGIDGMVMPLT
jgi:hypothetical protein